MNWRNEKVLVAGGAGMIGSHIARALVTKGANVTIVDNMSSGTPKNIQDLDVPVVEVDLRDENICKRMTRRMTYVFQFAANMGGIGYITKKHADIIRDNYLININMLHHAFRNGVERYFYSSSACVYPSYKQTTADIIPLKEDDAYPAMPDESYGWEKLGTEQVCIAYQKDYDMDIRIGRFHNIYGEAFNAFDKDKGKAPCHMIMKAIKYPKERFVVWGDGRQTRSFLYIDDAVKGILKLFESGCSIPLNIGTDRAVTMDELAKIAIGISGKQIPIEHDTTKPQGVRGRNADLTLVKERIMWSPYIGLETGMERVYNWAIAHLNELDNI